MIVALMLAAVSAVGVFLYRRNMQSEDETEIPEMLRPTDPTQIYFYSQDDLQTGIQSLDRSEISATVASLGMSYGWSLAEARGFMACLHNEGDAKPNMIGDKSLPGGPSIGPGQVYLKTAKDLGLWQWDGEGSERDSYARLASDESTCMRMAAAVFQSKLNENGRDLPLAIERYNGSGPAARNYRDKALNFISETW